MRSDLLPSLVRMHEDDDLSLLDGTMPRLLDRGEDPTVRELAALIQAMEIYAKAARRIRDERDRSG
jgi:hypothetical protein